MEIEESLALFKDIEQAGGTRLRFHLPFIFG